jgi:periplasmic divalent cation tolerance protein
MACAAIQIPAYSVCRFVFTQEEIMLEPTSSARVVMATVGSAEQASRIGRALVKERLAACATLLPPVQSIYRWRDQIETSSETMLLIKTSVHQLPALETRLRELHTYETPEFLVLPVESGSHSYLDWLQDSMRQA